MSQEVEKFVEEYEDVEVIMMPQDDGSEAECRILAELELDGKSYMVLVPENDGVISGGIRFYGVEESDDELELMELEDEEELKKVREAYLVI